MRVTIIGGHGKVAMLLAPRLAAAGHEVRSVIRNPEHADEVSATGATPQVADIEALDTAALTDLLADTDALVWSAGAGGGNPARTYAVDRDAAIRSMDAAAAAGVERYVMVSYLGAGAEGSPHGVPDDSSFFPYTEAKTAADAHLRGSSLAWTILKPSALTLEPSTGGVDPNPPGPGQTSRELVAEVAAAVIDAPVDTVRGAELEFLDGPVPVAEAVAALGR